MIRGSLVCMVLLLGVAAHAGELRLQRDVKIVIPESHSWSKEDCREFDLSQMRDRITIYLEGVSKNFYNSPAADVFARWEWGLSEDPHKWSERAELCRLWFRADGQVGFSLHESRKNHEVDSGRCEDEVDEFERQSDTVFSYVRYHVPGILGWKVKCKAVAVKMGVVPGAAR